MLTAGTRKIYLTTCTRHLEWEWAKRHGSPVPEPGGFHVIRGPGGAYDGSSPRRTARLEPPWDRRRPNGGRADGLDRGGRPTTAAGPAPGHSGSGTRSS